MLRWAPDDDSRRNHGLLHAGSPRPTNRPTNPGQIVGDGGERGDEVAASAMRSVSLNDYFFFSFFLCGSPLPAEIVVHIWASASASASVYRQEAATGWRFGCRGATTRAKRPQAHLREHQTLCYRRGSREGTCMALRFLIYQAHQQVLEDSHLPRRR